MYEMVRYDSSIEARLHELVTTPSEEAYRLLENWEQAGLQQEDIYLLLALGSARWIDHHGPWIGHGTLNLGPLLRASVLLDESDRRLALLQATIYVLDLMRNPNYGPYLQLQMAGTQEATAAETATRLHEMALRGGYTLLSENLFVGLYRQDADQAKESLYRLGLHGYPHNEHRLLIVHRTYDLLAFGNHKNYGESLLRPAIQYLASLPKYPISWERVEPALAQIDSLQLPLDLTTAVDIEEVRSLLDQLLTAETGQEVHLIVQRLQRGVTVSTVLEAVSLAGPSLLLQSPDFEEHIVTGLNCITEIVRDSSLPDEIRWHALLVSLENVRTRQMKSARTEWLARPSFQQDTAATVTLDAIHDLILHDPDGFQTATSTAQYVQNGGDVDALTQLLMKLALITQGPFLAIHAVKMIWAQGAETKLSHHPDRYLHLASAACYLARYYENGKKGAQRVQSQFGL